MSKKVLFILMPKGFKDVEFLTPYRQLKNKGHHVDVAGLEPGEASGSDGATHTPNVILSELSPQDLATYDALIIPGGPGSRTYLWGNKEIQNAVKQFHENKSIVATICAACIVPAEAGIVRGKTTTVYPTPEAKKLFEKHGVTFTDKGCVVIKEDKIIMAQGPKFVEEFAQEILRMLSEE